MRLVSLWALLLCTQLCTALARVAITQQAGQSPGNGAAYTYNQIEVSEYLAEGSDERSLLEAATDQQQTPTPDASAAPQAMDDLYKPIFNAHNSYRAQHRVPALVWSDSLAAGAAQSAARCTLKSDSSNAAAENLFGTTATDDPAGVLAWAVETWYSAGDIYDYSKPGFSKATGTFTQLVWKSSRSIGCAIKTCKDGVQNTVWSQGSIVVCRYSPPGNVAGDFEKNVFPAKDSSGPPRPPPSPESPAPPPATNPTPPRSPNPTPPPSTGDNSDNASGSLPTGILPGGLMLVSPKCYRTTDRTYRICMQDNANIALFKSGQVIWTSNTAGKSTAAPFTLIATDSGNIIAYDADHHVFYSSL